jgi:hypothetical protein
MGDAGRDVKPCAAMTESPPPCRDPAAGSGEPENVSAGGGLGLKVTTKRGLRSPRVCWALATPGDGRSCGGAGAWLPGLDATRIK